MARTYYSKDVPKYQFIDVPYLPTEEVGHTPTSCKPEDLLYLTKLETEAFIKMCKRKFKKNYLIYKLETITVQGVTKHYLRIGHQPLVPESVEQWKALNPLPQKWDGEALRYLSQRNYKW